MKIFLIAAISGVWAYWFLNRRIERVLTARALKRLARRGETSTGGRRPRPRLIEALEKALELAKGLVILDIGDESVTYSSSRTCPKCGKFTVPELEPRLFSFNDPQGACATCHGLGTLSQFTEEKLTRPELSLADGTLACFTETSCRRRPTAAAGCHRPSAVGAESKCVKTHGLEVRHVRPRSIHRRLSRCAGARPVRGGGSCSRCSRRT